MIGFGKHQYQEGADSVWALTVGCKRGDGLVLVYARGRSHLACYSLLGRWKHPMRVDNLIRHLFGRRIAMLIYIPARDYYHIP